jgi:hypothetical protein
MLNGLFMVGAGQSWAASNAGQYSGEVAARTASEVRAQNEAIQFDVEKLLMITEALWLMMKQQHGYTDEQLVQMIQDIDLRDGKLDGKAGKSTETPTCPQCARPTNRRQSRCLYCGTVVPQKPFDR